VFGDTEFDFNIWVVKEKTLINEEYDFYLACKYSWKGCYGKSL